MKMFTTILLIICGVFLLGSLVYFSGDRPKGGFGEIITRVYAGGSTILEDGIIAINPNKEIYTGNYKVFRKTGNESLFDVTFNKTPVNVSIPINSTYNSSYIREDTIVCLEAGWDNKKIINDTYYVPSSLSFYKNETLVKQTDLTKTKAASLSPTTPLNPNRFCYQANPEKDFYFKFGENSVIIIQENDYVSTSLLDEIVVEANFTHLNISGDAPYGINLTGYWNFDSDLENTKLTTNYDFTQYDKDGDLVDDAVVNSSNCIDGYGNCAQLDGVGDYIDLGVPDPIENIPGLTVSIWAKNTVTDIRNDVLFVARVNNNQDVMRIKHGSNGVYTVTVSNGTATSLLDPTDVWDGNTDWHHIVVTYNGSVNVYLDGSFDGSGNFVGGNTHTGGASQIMRVGAHTDYWNGTIDEVMIFNTSLTPAQVTDIYNNQSARFKPEGTQKVRAVKVTNGTNWDNNGYNRVNLTLDYQANKNSNLSARIGQINLSVNNSGLQLYMPFDWDGPVDISNGNDGTLVGESFINQTGGLNSTGGAEFDGSGNDYVSITDAPGLSINESADGYTVTGWFNTDIADGTFRSIICKGTGANYEYCLNVRNEMGFDLWDSGGTGIGTATGGSISAGRWYHFAFVWNKTGAGVYIDSVFTFSDTTITGSFTDGTAPVTIGARGDLGTTEYDGQVDNIMIFNRSLTAEEISNLHSNQSANKTRAYYTDYQNITGNPTNFTINPEADFVFPDFTFIAGNTSHPFYTPILNGSIILETWNFTVAVAPDTCDCPGSGNWDIDDGTICSPTSDCSIGTNKLRITSGGLRVNSGITVRTGGCYVETGEILYADTGGGLFCGNQ